MIQPEMYGSTVQLNTYQDSARRNFFHRFQQVGILIKKVLLATQLLPLRCERWLGLLFFVLIEKNNPGEIRGFFIASAWQVRGKDALGGQMWGKLLMFYDKCEIL
jgi:hypothetical protein